MEGLQNNFKLPNPDLVRNSVMNNAGMESSFMSYLITDDDLEGLNTVNETVLDDYSQASTAILANTTQESVVSQIVTSISESPDSFNLLASQINLDANSNLDFGPPNRGSPNLDLSDEDILPASPNPPCRTPSSSMRSSAFVTMAIGSPVQGSLRTLRNIEEASSTPPPAVNLENATPISVDATVTKKESSASFKAMRQIHFENDNSNQSTGESPSSFLSEPGRAIDSSIPKPTVNRPIEYSEEADESGSSKIDNSLGNIFAESCEADSSQNLLRTSPIRDPDSQSHNLVECFDTQDLLPKTVTNVQVEASFEQKCSLDFSSSKLELSLDTSSTPDLQTFETTAIAKEAVVSSEAEPEDVNQPSTVDFQDGDQPKDDSKGSSETIERVSSMDSTPESVKEPCIPFEAVLRFYNPIERTWILRTTTKFVPGSKLESLVEGSVSDYVKMGLFDHMESDMLAGSRLEPLSELLHRHHNSCGYNADVSQCSSKSDSIVSRSLRLSTASTFDSGPIACSSLLSRASLENPSGHSIHSVQGEFAVPKNPALRYKLRGGTKTPENAHQTSAESLSNSEAPDSTESPETETVPAANVEGDVEEDRADDGDDSGAYTALRVLRKRGRKPKIPDVIRESDSSSSTAATPPKKGRRGRPPSCATPDKQSSAAVKQLDLDVEMDVGEKLSEDYIKDVEQEWRDLKSSSYETGKLVFAQWTDKCYYAAKMTARDAVQAGKWNVKFLDGQSRNLVEEFILPVSVLNKNQSVLVLNENLSEGRPGIVVSHQKGAVNDVDHVVEMDNGGTLVVPRHRICMTQDQMRLWNDLVLIPQLFSPHTCNVSLDNILGGKRRTRSINDPQFGSPVKTTPRSSTTPRTPRTPRAQSVTPAETRTPKSSRPSLRSGSLRKKLTGKRDLIMDTSTLSESSGTSLLHTEHSLRHQLIKRMELGQLEHPEISETGAEIDEKITGPLPSDHQLFDGFAFILTKTTKPLQIDAESMSDEVEPYLEPTVYHKNYLRKQLEAGGGTVLERFEQAYADTSTTILVIANRPCRTERYVRSLAANIRAVSHDWVYQCCQRNKLLSWERYLLPPGIDLDGQVVEWTRGTGRCFHATRILLYGATDFCDLWQPILVQAQCVIVFRLRQHPDDPELEDEAVLTDYVVTTRDCPTSIVESARRMNIPVVSSEWVVQSLIHGQKLDPASRPQFDYHFSPGA